MISVQCLLFVKIVIIHSVYRLPHFALADHFYCDALPDEFQGLTWVEEMVCAIYRTSTHVTQIYELSDSKDPFVSHGNMCTHEMNVVLTVTYVIHHVMCLWRYYTLIPTNTNLSAAQNGESGLGLLLPPLWEVLCCVGSWSISSSLFLEGQFVILILDSDPASVLSNMHTRGTDFHDQLSHGKVNIIGIIVLASITISEIGWSVTRWLYTLEKSFQVGRNSIGISIEHCDIASFSDVFCGGSAGPF